MKKKTICNLSVLLVFGFCLFCGCGGKSSSSEAWWLRLSGTVSKEEQDTQEEEADASGAEEDLTPGYWAFHALRGLGKEEVSDRVGQELTYVEEKSNNYDVYAAGNVEYQFYKEVDALMEIRYTNLNAEEAEMLASDCFREMYLRYGDDVTYPMGHQIREFTLDMDDMAKCVEEQKIEQYNQLWRQPYPESMEEKVKDYYATDKVRLGVDLLTPYFMDQGTYTVCLYHFSVPLGQTDASAL